MRTKSIYLFSLISLFVFGSNKAEANNESPFSSDNAVLTISKEKSPETNEQGQNKVKVTGKVVDEKGEAVIGASVLEKGTTNGTSTNIDGVFTLSVKVNSALVISYIGYRTQVVSAGKNMKVVLVEESKSLDEVVVIGYGVQKKKLVTGATVQVKGDDIAKLNTVDVMGALQSQAPGVNITQSNGFIGSGYTVNIRGIGTIGDSEPLYVVDGVANASLDGLNPSDIESVDILKDAASSAIYGARAANGVILITTKQGKSGTSVVSYDGYYGVQNLYKIPTILNAKEYMSMQDEGRVMDGLDSYNWSNYIPAKDLKIIEDGTWKGTNWLKEIKNKNAVVQNHSLNFSGGTPNSTYSVGLSMTTQEATMGVPSAVPDLHRYNFRVNTSQIVKKMGDLDFLKVGETINYKYEETRGSFGTGGIYWNGVHNMLVMSPLMHAYDYNGDYYMYRDRVADGYNWDISNSSDKNPIAYLDYFMNQNKNKRHYLQSSVYAELQPMKNLRIKSQFGYIYGSSSYRSYVPTYELTSTLISDKDQVAQSMSIYNRWSWENTANYLYNLNDHHFDILVGSTLERSGYGESLNGTKVGSYYTDLSHGRGSKRSLMAIRKIRV